MKNNTDKDNKKEDKKSKLIFIIVFTILLVILEYLLRDFLKYINSFINYLQDKEQCKHLEYFEFYELSGRYFLLFTIYNLVNVYAALSFIFLDSFSVFINGIVRFFYLDPRPFWENPNLIPCFCAVDYGNPSTTGINLFLIFSTLYKSFTYRSKSLKKKLFFIILGMCIILYTSTIRVLQNVHYIHQLLYGLGIGYIIFYIFFEILEVNFDDEKTFFKIIDNPIIVIITCIILYLFSNLFHLALNLQPRKEFIENVSKNCVINPIFAFDNESYTKSPRIFEFLGYYLGVWLEYKIIFNTNYDKFIRYNLVNNNRFVHEKFNETKQLTSILRILIMYFAHISIVSKLILSKYIKPPSESIIFSIIVRLIIPYFLEGIFNFFVIKFVYKKLKLTNEKLFEDEDEDDFETSKNVLLLDIQENEDETEK